MAEYSRIQLSLKADRIINYGADKHMAYFSGVAPFLCCYHCVD